jgi:Pyruvate/2-oxoacid:ferredoxin oxidoreductase delta subunit
MARRQIVEIDRAKCDGCGQCVPACAEGAIRVVDGKAELVADVYCDGLGACLGECPRGAITIIERDAQPFDEALAGDSRHTAPAGDRVPLLRRSSAERDPLPDAACKQTVAHRAPAGCPGAAMRDLRLSVVPAAAANRLPPQPAQRADSPALAHWPIQLRLVPADAPFLRQADLFLVADCVPFACAGFHEQVLRRRPIIIGCPKLDNAAAYVDKLAEMLVQCDIRSLTVVHMEVPCCTNLLRIAGEALRIAGSQVPLHDITVSISGEILSSSDLSPRIEQPLAASQKSC